MWLKKALTITTLEPNDYYIVTDPIQFYEWKWDGFVPKGTKVSRQLPPTQIFTDGAIVVSAALNPETIKDGVLACDVRTNLKMKIGQIQSPNELLQRYDNLEKEFNRQLDDFRKNSVSQKYIVSHGKQPHLYRIVTSDDNTVRLENFGTMKDVGEKLSEFHKSILRASHEKKGRSYEWSDVRTFDNIFTFMNNKGLQADGAKFDIVISKSNLKPHQSKDMTWAECYSEISPKAADAKEKMRIFRSLRWVCGSKV